MIRIGVCTLNYMNRQGLVQVMPYDMYEGALRMDGATLINLDLVETSDGGIKGSLLSCLDTCASAGASHTYYQQALRGHSEGPAIWT